MTDTIGTPRTQVVMDYDDLTRMMEELADKVADKVRAITQTPNDGQDQDRLLSAKEVRAIFSVTDKTLHVWDKTGFLPRVRIGGVVRYRREDVERAAQVKGK